MRSEQPSTKETNHPRVIFSLISFFDSDYNLAIHLSSISASISFQRKSLEPKSSLSTSTPILHLKKTTPHTNRRPTINYAAASGIWSMICGTSPPVAVPNANAV
jgi:hypothetical protein